MNPLHANATRMQQQPRACQKADARPLAAHTTRHACITVLYITQLRMHMVRYVVDRAMPQAMPRVYCMYHNNTHTDVMVMRSCAATPANRQLPAPAAMLLGNRLAPPPPPGSSRRLAGSLASSSQPTNQRTSVQPTRNMLAAQAALMAALCIPGRRATAGARPRPGTQGVPASRRQAACCCVRSGRTIMDIPYCCCPSSCNTYAA